MASPISRREDIMAALADVFRDIKENAPAADPYGLEFSIVTRTPLDDSSWRKRHSIGVHDTSERKQDFSSLRHGMLNVVLEFRVTLQQGEEVSTELNRVLAVVQRALAENNTLGGRCIQISETENFLYIEEVQQRRAIGTLFATIMYRHATDDVRRRS